MIVQSFRSVMWVGAIAAAAIGCYMVSLRVASERATLEDVETAILMVKRDIRALDTELSTRGRLRQLERWNNDVLALTAPTEGQFLEGEVQLAGLAASVPQATAPVSLAAAPSREARSGDNEPVLAAYRPRTRDDHLGRASAPAKATRDKPTATSKSPAAPRSKAEPLATSKDGSGKAKSAAKEKATAKSAATGTKTPADKLGKPGSAKIASGKKAKAAKAL